MAPSSFFKIYLLSTLNNIHMTVTDGHGKTLFKCSSGSLGFKGSRKSFRNAAQAVGESVGKSVVEFIGEEVSPSPSDWTLAKSGLPKSSSFSSSQEQELPNQKPKTFERGPEIQVSVICRGIGNGKEAGIRGLRTAGVQIVRIDDQTAIAHNGCRLPKRRRV